MTYDAQGQYGGDPRYQQGQYPPQYPQNPQYPQGPQQYPPANPYPQQTPGYPPSDPYAQPGANDPTAPVAPPYGGGAANPYGGGAANPGGSYGGNDPYSGGGAYAGSGGGAYGGQYGAGQYGADPYSAVPSSGWPAPGSVPPGGVPPRKPKTGLIVGLAAGGVALVLVLGGLAVAGAQLLDDDPDDPPPTNVAGGGDPSAEPPSDDPFANTPAASFASGAEGIQLPEPTEVGDFSADQVSDMLDQVRESLIATRLDEAMLFEHDSESFVSSMAPDNQDGLRDAFSNGEFGYFATQIADGADLAVPEPRVQGTITFEATTDDQGFRVIEAVTKFVWAYAFVVPADNPDLDGIVVVRDELTWQVAHEDDVAESSLGLWLWDGNGYASGIDCDQFEQSLIAPQTELSFGGGDGPDEGEIYDPNASLDLPDTC